MKIRVDADEVYADQSIPRYDWQTYQRGFLGILNNSYNQSCNAGIKILGQMSDVASEFERRGGGSWQEFVRMYVREFDGHEKTDTAIIRMATNMVDRIASVGGYMPYDQAEWWSRKYIWSMILNTYIGFCSESVAIKVVADEVGTSYSTETTVWEETNGIDGYIGAHSVQIKPQTYLGNLDHSGYDADFVISYSYDDDEFVFDVPSGLI